MTPEDLLNIRHSLAHILAMAVLRLFPEAKLAIGPAVDNGFYYDFALGQTIIPADLLQLEKIMKKIIKENIVFERSSSGYEEAKQLFKNQPYKLELIEDLRQKKIDHFGLYRSGNFTDLCKGPHLKNTREIPEGCFELSHAAGAYWKGDEKRPMLQRIYGLAFASKSELREYKEKMALAKKNDHRLLGPKLGLYMFSEDVGAGLPLWLPKGEKLRYLLEEYMREKEEALGYKYVFTPVLTQEELYLRSGHAKYYAQNMYSFVDQEENRFYLKPMNCPHHHLIYEKLVTSYRDLPLKLAEAGGGIYRHELSGTLSGLIRVRGAITQNDAHIYVSYSQLKEEFKNVLDLFKVVYQDLGLTNYWFRLSLPDFQSNSQKYGGETEKWSEASSLIRESLTEFGVPFVEAPGEAAFYGPKVDVQIKNVSGKEDSIATIQVDILVPKRMGLCYVDPEGKQVQPIVIHRAILGSFERFIAFLLEQTGGNLPFWLAPVQIAILAVSEQYFAAADDLADLFKQNKLRVYCDLSSESVAKKIRNSSLLKIPLKIVIGEKEVALYQKNQEWELNLNWRSDFDQPDHLKLDQLLKTCDLFLKNHTH